VAAPDKSSRVQKYDLAAETYSTRYADPAAVARRQVDLIRGWGATIPPGAAILEIGCADGFVTEYLARAGFRVTALDFSERMVDVAARRLRVAGLDAEFLVADVDAFDPPGIFDVTAAFMCSFFTLSARPREVLHRLARATRRKVLVDLDPRRTAVASAVDEVRATGLSSVEWRGFFVPQRIRMGAPGLALLRVAEQVPIARNALLRWKFTAVVKGERGEPGSLRM
jgi:SAM-dependent methyltransferase